jgi:hypothetical protein
MNAREKTNRDNEIVAARMRGQSWMTIAANYGLSERQCQQILADYRASHPRLRQRDPIEIVDDMLDHYQGAQEELAEISATSKHDATRVGAIRTRLDALAAQASLLRAVGVLPRDLGVLRADIDAQARHGRPTMSSIGSACLWTLDEPCSTRSAPARTGSVDRPCRGRRGDDQRSIAIGRIGSIGVPFLHITEVRISIPVIAVVGARRAAR